MPPGQETIMRTITAVIAAVGVLGIAVASAPAQAHDDDDGGWRRQEWREHQWRERGHTYADPPVVYAQPGYYVPPPQVYYAQPPVYYAPPPPVYYAPPPVYGPPGFSIGLSFR